MAKRIVVKLSGNVFKEAIEKSDLEPFIDLFSELRRKGMSFVLVAGGGKTARRYIAAAREMGADESTLDETGIAVTRLNATLLIVGFKGLAYSSVPTSLSEIAEAFDKKGLVITGGLHPGQSTNATACLIAERIRADLFLNATSVAGVYTKDPNLHKNARMLKTVTVPQLRDMLSTSFMGAGTYDLMDLVALKIIERSHIPSRIILSSPPTIKQALEGSETGTLLLPG